MGLSKQKRYSNAPGLLGLLGRVYSPKHSIARHKNCWCTGNVLNFRALNENYSKKLHEVFSKHTLIVDYNNSKLLNVEFTGIEVPYFS